MRKLVILCGALALAACGSEKSGTVETKDGTAEYTVDTEGDGGTMTIKTKDGEVNFQSGSNAGDVDLPNGFTVYPAAEVVTNAKMSGDTGSSVNLIMNTSASPDQVVAFYRKQAEAAGVEISSEMSMDKVRIVGGQSKDGLNFSVHVSPGEDGKTTVSLGLNREKTK
ncbi:hypothetical protein [Altererythrobacter fulvus]|uniref:hypothetical protein n=1 Tax=Caenibius fulvus TaxID=2126012 RepID=UPI0030177D92